ncbi:hypothetical protein JTE90_012393 [Oedothorax gibbosus]|uniref:Reverse transcriptase domain-containing protein n=1 Tax=Oedothorax gibbosus TaxID=931172 RepID=A0AAV6TW07_9ARAC|nr:hypothetical protein JTE90_012393 [Oedothorax gibbosus]
MSYSTSAGPDGITIKTWNRVPARAKSKLYSLWIRIGLVPLSLISSRTIFIAKKADATSPADARPVSIATIILRQYHKILARRLTRLLEDVLDPTQLGFRPFDGIARRLYNGESSEPVKPNKGVRQGDPLSPLLFLVDFDNILRAVPAYEGAHLPGEEEPTNKIAHADDLVLIANSPLGLQNIFQRIGPVLEATGLRINSSKTITFQWLKDGKRKKMIFDNRTFVKVRGQPLRALEVDEEFQYLGIQFTPKGKLPPKLDLKRKLEILRTASLKPQQKIFFLAKHLLLGFQHMLTFGKLYSGYLKKLDVIIRSFIRAFLKLPEDTPTAAFHASIRDGGLGVPSMRWGLSRRWPITEYWVARTKYSLCGKENYMKVAI